MFSLAKSMMSIEIVDRDGPVAGTQRHTVSPAGQDFRGCRGQGSSFSEASLSLPGENRHFSLRAVPSLLLEWREKGSESTLIG